MAQHSMFVCLTQKRCHLAFLAVHQESSQLEAFRERLEEASPGLDEESVCVFHQLFKSGELSEGGGDDAVKSLGGRFFSVILRECNAPEVEIEVEMNRSSRLDPPLFWSTNLARINYVTKVFRACMLAGFPLVIVGDAPIESVIGMAANDTLDRGYSGLGKTGRGSLFLVKGITKEFVRSWTAGGVEEDCLKHPWTIQDLEVRKSMCIIEERLTPRHVDLQLFFMFSNLFT